LFKSVSIYEDAKESIEEQKKKLKKVRIIIRKT